MAVVKVMSSADLAYNNGISLLMVRYKISRIQFIVHAFGIPGFPSKLSVNGDGYKMSPEKGMLCMGMIYQALKSKLTKTCSTHM